MRIRTAFALSLLATSCLADGHSWPQRMWLEPARDRCFAVVRITDISGTYNESETLETEHGPVVIRYTTVGTHSFDPDFVDVLSTPPGVVAVPVSLKLVDGPNNEICLIRADIVEGM